MLYQLIVSNCPGPEHHVFCILIVDIILGSALSEFNLLRASDYYYRKGPVCYVLTFYSNYCYGELSIFVTRTICVKSCNESI